MKYFKYLIKQPFLKHVCTYTSVLFKGVVAKAPDFGL